MPIVATEQSTGIERPAVVEVGKEAESEAKEATPTRPESTEVGLKRTSLFSLPEEGAENAELEVPKEEQKAEVDESAALARGDEAVLGELK